MLHGLRDSDDITDHVSLRENEEIRPTRVCRASRNKEEFNLVGQT